MTDELWEKVRQLRDGCEEFLALPIDHNSEWERDHVTTKRDTYQEVCRLAGRPLPEWREKGETK